MEEYIKEALQQDFIVPSTSPAASTALEELRGARIFSKLDLRSAYNLVLIHSGDEWKTAFITPAGHYHYRVMPYGLVNAPSVFQSFMNKVFREFLHQFVVVYIDDILIYSRNLAEHRHHVAQVLLKLRQHHLYLKAEKCEFHQNTIQFLGYVIGPDGISMDTNKVAAIWDWPQPTSVKELQRFLGFANFYRRFINQFSLLSATLTNLLKEKPKTLIWTPSASQAFASLKSAFCTAPALVLPDPQEPFIVEVDVSTIGAGAVLSQYPGEPPKLHPCAFFSRKFSLAEQNYDIGNRELLAIKLWRNGDIGSRALDIRSPFRFTITYRPGHKNVKADALSRLHQPDLPTTSDPILPPEHFLCPIIWDLDRQLQESTSLEPVPPGGPEDKLYVPSSMRSALLDSVHSSPGSGHPGSKRTLSLLRSRFWWPQMASEVSQHVRACSVCAMTNTPRQLPCGKLVPLPIPTRPWSHIGIDFVTDLPSSNNYTCILVIVNRFSKSCKFIPLNCLPTAMETAEALLHFIFRYHGLPEDIVSDRGPQFISRVWHAFFRNLQISVSLSSGYHPQTNGQTERKIQELVRYLRAYCSSDQHDWSRYLPWAEYVQNSLRQSTTGLTPFQCVLGYQPALFPWSGEPSNVPAVDHWFRESERVWDSAHVHLQHAVQSHKIFADVRRRLAPTFQPGELVWLSTKDIRLRLPCKKLKSDGTEVPPPPEILEDPSIYRVKEILNSRRRGGQIEYLIDWEGYGPEERSWIPRKDILDPTLLSEFHQQHPERPAPRPRGRPRHHFRASGAARGGGGTVSTTPGRSDSFTTPTRSQSPAF
ncbi:Transposon Tf2-6 polyprotein [Labeo rohita]|uniref:Gypsy retrotransposon integrase-like protein 1 n=1 Tax=Labeo rohita TaxID=84645 RepID=A0ABQ8L4J4_LABRO|nr:Transposon Tf2-6 polyprotein [Labeo rohita]